MRTYLLVVTVTLGLAAGAAAQPAAFDAASVKRFTGDEMVRPIVVRPGQLFAAAATLRDLIQAGFGVDRNQVVEGPSWVKRDLFEINAAIPAGATVNDVRTMLRRLLTERFDVVTHREQRELAVYVLQSTAKTGPELRMAGNECRPVASPPGVPAPPAPPPAPPGFESVVIFNQPKLEGNCPSMYFTGYMSVRDLPISVVALQLSRILRRPVIDRTGLEGRFDFDLAFAPEATVDAIGAAGVVGGGPDAPSNSSEAPALSTAIRDRLGLRLESTRAPVDVVVIDRASKPTEN